MANSARNPRAPKAIPIVEVCSFLVLALLCVPSASSAQGAASLSQVKTIYVEPLGHGALGKEFRDRVAERLRKDGHIAVLESSAQADAVMSGSAEIWPTGHASNSPHSPKAAEQTVYTGYLSARITGKNSEVLWSYLVTPRRIAWGGIVHDLADNLAAKLLEARQGGTEAAAGSPAPGAEAISLHGAGATFPAPLYQKWFQSFQEQEPNHHVDYDAVGSGEGIRQLAYGKVDFAASDMPLSDDRMSQLGTRFQHFATVLGAVVPVYNLAHVTRPLKFEADVLADIYLGKIKRWNDPRIRASNHGVSLPDTEIVVIHRSDGSGTTFVWSDFLGKVSPEWKSSVGSGSELKWPVGIGAERSEGVVVAVQETPNSIGYVEMIFALQHQLSFGAVRNAEGEFIRADLSSITTAAASGTANMTSDFRVSITNAPGAGAYPISSFTWLLIPTEANRKADIRELVRWILTSGQRECAELGYAPLPRDVVNRELDALADQK